MKRSAGENERKRDQLREDAWIGDAVLLLFARGYVLQELGRIDDVRCTRFTSNEFLNAVGNPTEVEGTIGRIYRAEGLEAAMRWTEGHLVPIFRRQDANRKRKGGKTV